MSLKTNRSAYWSVSVCIRKDEKLVMLDRLQRLIPYKYMLIITNQEDNRFVLVDMYVKFLKQINKTQFIFNLSGFGLTYGKNSIQIHTKNEVDMVRLRSRSSIEFGFWKDESPEDVWDGPVNTDMRKFELEQEDDIHDVCDNVSIRKVASKWRKEDNPVRISHIKRIITEDGELGDPETHKRKQRRLEEDLKRKLDSVNESDTEIDEPDLK